MKIRDSVRVILVYVVLFVVMESDEGIFYIVMWLDVIDDKKLCKVRRVSIGSFNKFFLYF